MSKKSKKKKVVVVKKEKSTLEPSKSRKAFPTAVQSDLLFGKKNYMFLILSFGLILLGMLLMAGGNQEPTQWNENEIYSFRRTVLAPIVILSGLGVGMLAIFSKKD